MKSLSSDLLAKINTPLQTISNNADPKMEINIARAKNTITDVDPWTVEIIREISGLGDVSVAPRRFNIYGRPNRIYEIHIRDNIVYTSIREYPDKLKEGFKTQFSLGPGTSVGVAFNGDWKRYRKFYRLVTEEKPWISWVDNLGNLWTQKWDDTNSKFQLSSNVVQVKMIRAWKNLVIQQQDQGVVVAYIKNDGKVYYRNYCQQEDYSEMWEYEKELTSFTGSAANVNLFITNDYRMGFIVEDAWENIHWFITPRNWGGMASPAESIVAGIKKLMLKVTPIKYYESFDTEHLSTALSPPRLYMCPADAIPEIIETKRLEFPDNKTIKLIFNYDLECDLENLKKSLTLQNLIAQPFEVDTVTEFENILTIKTVDEMPPSQDIRILYDMIESYYLAFRVTSSCLLNSAPINLIVKGRPPVGYIDDHLTMDIILPTFEVTQVYYRDAFARENLETSISSINITVTQVGNNPL